MNDKTVQTALVCLTVVSTTAVLSIAVLLASGLADTAALAVLASVATACAGGMVGFTAPRK